VGTGERRLKRLIVTADDFGISVPVNEAVESAHKDGILTTTCLMVAGDAAPDAVARAKRLPSLAVGLHVVTVCGRPILPPGKIPDLVDEAGNFDKNLVRAGFRYFFLPRVRRQLELEIRAQFAAFAATGLSLDHVNAHNHMHIHPTIFAMIIRIGREYGLCAVRFPWEPPTNGKRRSMGDAFLGIWLSMMKRRASRAGLRFNERMYGLRASGHMDREHWMAILANLPDGVSEAVGHPATGRWEGIDPAAHDYRFEAEYKALIDGDVRELAARPDIELISFRDI